MVYSKSLTARSASPTSKAKRLAAKVVYWRGAVGGDVEIRDAQDNPEKGEYLIIPEILKCIFLLH